MHGAIPTQSSLQTRQPCAKIHYLCVSEMSSQFAGCHEKQMLMSFSLTKSVGCLVLLIQMSNCNF